MRIFLYGLGLSVFVSRFVLASETTPPEAVPPVMYQFLGHVSSLQPLMVNESSYSDKTNRKQILDHLTRIHELSGDLDKHHQLDGTSFHISIEFLKDHIRDAKQSFEVGNTEYSRRMLFATLNACGSCHAQVEKKGVEWTLDTERLQGSTFEKAEFLYALRQYNQAEPMYMEIIEDFKVGSTDRFELDRAIERILSINLRNRRDLSQARKRIEEFQKNKKLPKNLLETLPRWEKEAKELQRKSPPSIETATASQLESYVQSILPLETARQLNPDEHLVAALYLSGLIYQFVNSKSAQQISPLLLYWLATFEDSLQEDYIYSLAEFYLKECIVRYPQTETASLCYLQLEQKLVSSFTGSAGVQIPEDVQNSLNRLRAWIRRAQESSKSKQKP